MKQENVGKNIYVWKKIYAEGKNDLRYPSDVLVRMGSRLFNPKNDKKILDFGFGTGANLIHFARQGYSLFGVEISGHAIQKTEERLSVESLSADLTLMPANGKLPYADSFFDIVISWQVLYYNDWDSLSKTVTELERVLKPGGLVLVTMLAPGDISHQQADSIGNCFYRTRVEGQEGCMLLIPERKDLSTCFPERKLDIGEFGFSWGGITSRHWIVLYRKD